MLRNNTQDGRMQYARIGDWENVTLPALATGGEGIINTKYKVYVYDPKLHYKQTINQRYAQQANTLKYCTLRNSPILTHDYKHEDCNMPIQWASLCNVVIVGKQWHKFNIKYCQQAIPHNKRRPGAWFTVDKFVHQTYRKLWKKGEPMKISRENVILKIWWNLTKKLGKT